ncbi:MAG TPA: glutamate--cysteine ligase, partial [Erythrobacter sp.]|nr:glutamate--cysteine ligase [Erythrobacter sp.]
PMQRGEKPKADWRIGTEHEKLVYGSKDHRALSYEEEGGIRDILLSLREFGWEPIEEGGKVIAMRGSDGTVSL